MNVEHYNEKKKEKHAPVGVTLESHHLLTALGIIHFQSSLIRSRYNPHFRGTAANSCR